MMNIFFSDLSLQSKDLVLGKNSLMGKSESNSIFSQVLSSAMSSEEQSIVSNMLFEISDLSSLLASDISSMLPIMNKGKETSNSFFSKLFFETLHNDSSSSILEVQSAIDELATVLAVITKLNSHQVATIESLIQQLTSESEELQESDIFTDQEIAQITNRFGTLDKALSVVEALLQAMNKDVVRSKEPVNSIFQQSNQQPLLVKSLLATNHLEELPIDQQKSSKVTLAVLQSLKDSGKFKELLLVLNKLIAYSEQKQFQDEMSLRQPVVKGAAIPLHLQNQISVVRPMELKVDGKAVAEDVKITTKESVNSPTVSVTDHRIVTFGESGDKSQNHNHQQALPQESVIKEQGIVSNNLNANNQVTKSNVSEVKLSYTNQNEFQKQVEELVVNQAKLVKKPNGLQTMMVTLHPAKLGSMQIIVTANQGIVTTSIVTDSVMTKELIENTINNLRLALVNTGIQIDRIDVQQQNNVNQSVAQSANAQSHLQQQKRNQEQNEEQSNKKNKNIKSFSVKELEELALEFISENQLDRKFSTNEEGYSAAVNYTA